MNTLDYHNYFESKALNHTMISHTSQKDGECGFFWLEDESRIAGVRSAIVSSSQEQSPAILCLAPYQVEPVSKDSSNPTESIIAAFMILVRVGSVNDSSAVASALSKAEVITRSIYKRIELDANQGNLFGINYGDIQIDINDVQFDPLMRMHNNFYGWVCNITFLVSSEICVDGSMWNDLPNQNILIQQQ